MNSKDVLLFTRGKFCSSGNQHLYHCFQQTSQVITYINLLLPGDHPGPAGENEVYHSC
jgi:hypothetical protein